MNVLYSSDVLLEQYRALKEFHQNRTRVQRGIALPSDISETITGYILQKLGDKTCRPAKRGDLVSDQEGIVQVKCFTSPGPVSFGSSTYWDVIYFLDAKEWFQRDWFRLYRVNLSSTDPRWTSLRFTTSNTFASMIHREREDQGIPTRPRCAFDKLLPQFGDACTIVYEGTIHEILDTTIGFPVQVVCEKKGRPRMIDLFAGTGAFSLAFSAVGAIPVFANDMDETSKALYEFNLCHRLHLGNLHDIPVEDIPDHDILTAGFPCQPFSIAGDQKGFDDPRANVFYKILEIIRTYRPRCILLENVPNIIRHDPFEEMPSDMPEVYHRCQYQKMGRTMATICSSLENQGYHLHVRLYNTSHVTGIPQNRQRMYLVGFRNKADFDKVDLDLPFMEKRPLSDFLETNPPEKYYYSTQYKAEIVEEVENMVQKDSTIYQYRRTLVRENQNGECPTLTANMGSGGHNVPLVRDPKGVRKLTPSECFRFQGFPNTYRLSKALPDSAHYKLAGNAVSYPIVEKLATRILASFG